MLRNWFPNRRSKTYAAESGYVYRYVFEGVRNEVEYIFTAEAGPSGEITIEVILSAELVEQWTRAHRPLNEIERFGVAKLALLRAFDRGADPAALERSIHPDARGIAEFCVQLDF